MPLKQRHLKKPKPSQLKNEVWVWNDEWSHRIVTGKMWIENKMYNETAFSFCISSLWGKSNKTSHT